MTHLIYCYRCRWDHAPSPSTLGLALARSTEMWCDNCVCVIAPGTPVQAVTKDSHAECVSSWHHDFLIPLGEVEWQRRVDRLRAMHERLTPWRLPF